VEQATGKLVLQRASPRYFEGVKPLGSDETSETMEAVIPAGISAYDALYLRVVAFPAP
jgi:hypothetical protein